MSKHIDADELRNIILADNEKLFKLRNTCIALSDIEVNDCQSYVYSRVLARMSECCIEDCSAEIEAMKIKLAQAVELLELAARHVPKECRTCKHWLSGGNGAECANGGCTDTEVWELWEWQHADKLAELKGDEYEND